MKTITIKEDGQSIYAFDDAVQITLGTNKTEMLDGSTDISITTETAILWQGVTLPLDWDAAKYCFDGTSWTINPLLVDPTPLPPKEVQSAARAEAYRTESDPLFFKAQRGEATMNEWLALVAEIKVRYPYPI